MIAQRVEKSRAWLNLRLALLSVHVETTFTVPESVSGVPLSLQLQLRPQVVGDSGACAGDTDAFQKPAPAWIVRLSSRRHETWSLLLSRGCVYWSA
jgi:hypothetical protein